MLIAMIFAMKMLQKKRLNAWQSMACFLGLFYFSMAKIQVKFICPIMIAWMLMLWPPLSACDRKNFLYKSISAMVLSIILIFGMDKCNQFFVKEKDNRHFWQYVKIYDLAGISVYSDQMWVPSFLWRGPKVTVQDIDRHYNEEWETLILRDRKATAPLRDAQNLTERKKLAQAWKEAVYKNPLAYLRHRAKVWFTTISYCNMKYKCKEWLKGRDSLFFLCHFLSFHSFAPFFVLSIYFAIIALRRIRNIFSIPLFMFSAMGIIMTGVLFFCSLASTSRYVYFSWCCFLFSIPFFWAVRRNQKMPLYARG
jgi:hypothetical protein